MKVNWKNRVDRDKFEEKIAKHKSRLSGWSSCEIACWVTQIYVLSILIIVGFYGSCAYIMVTEAMEEKLLQEDRMKNEWIREGLRK